MNWWRDGLEFCAWNPHIQISTHRFSLITLDKYSVSAFEAFCQRSNELYKAVKILQKGVCLGTVGDFVHTTMTDTVVGAVESDSEGEE